MNLDELFDLLPFAWPWVSTITLTVVWIACLMHIRQMGWHTSHCERFGFVFTAAGSFFLAYYPWWPKIESFPAAQLQHTGMALIALSLIRGQIRAFFIDHGFGLAERRHP